MGTRGRCRYSIAEWRIWYRDLLAAIDTLTPADVLARWVKVAAPSYDPAGRPPSAETLAAAPRYKYIERDGQWWVRDDDVAERPTGQVGISFDVVGPYLRLSGGEVIRDRGTARRRLGKLADDPNVKTLLGAFLTGRQDGKRKTMSPAILARAMVILGLRDAGMSHLRAVRTWLGWECEFHGPLACSDMFSILESGTRADAAEKQALREFEREVSLANRRTWSRLGVPVRLPPDLE